MCCNLGLRVFWIFFVLGVVTAFAAHDILGNLVSDLGIQFLRPFSMDNYITIRLQHISSLFHADLI